MPDETQPLGLPSGIVRDDEDLVCGDEQPYFPAQLSELQWAATDDRGRHHDTVTPRFRRVVAEGAPITVEPTPDHLHSHWDGDDLTPTDDPARDHDDPTSGPAVERIQPDADGRYTFETWLWNVHDAAEHLD